jgi:CRP-like cAMP-binding protein
MTPLLRNDFVEAAAAALPPNGLLQRIPPPERARLTGFLEVVSLKAGAPLCESGTPLRHVWFPHEAVAATVVQVPEGDAVAVGLLGPEALVGMETLYGARQSATTVVVQMPGRASRMDAGDFRREVVLRNAEPYRVFLRFAGTYQRLTAQIGACNARHSLVQRLARLLLMFDDRGARDVMEITQDRLADMLAARRASITEVANSLRAFGALEYRRGQIMIRNRRALLEASCQCYPVLASLIRRGDPAEGGSLTS